MTPAPIPDALLRLAYDRWGDHSGMTNPQMKDAYNRWLRGQRADRCHFGAEQYKAVDCHCLGCLQVLFFLYLDQVHAKLARPLSRHTEA